MSEFTVVDNRDTGQYEVAAGGDVAFLKYRRNKNRILLIHTEVPAALRGKGVAGLLARTALDTARADSLRVIVVCPYVKEYLDRHPEYLSLTRGASG